MFTKSYDFMFKVCSIRQRKHPVRSKGVELSAIVTTKADSDKSPAKQTAGFDNINYERK